MTDSTSNPNDADQPRPGITNASETIDSFAFFRIADRDRLLAASEAQIAKLPVSEATRRLISPAEVVKRADAHLTEAELGQIKPHVFDRKRLVTDTKSVLAEMGSKSGADLSVGSPVMCLLKGEAYAALMTAFAETFCEQVRDEYLARYADEDNPEPEQQRFDSNYSPYLDRLKVGYRGAALIDREGSRLDVDDLSRGTGIVVEDFKTAVFGQNSEVSRSNERSERRVHGIGTDEEKRARPHGEKVREKLLPRKEAAKQNKSSRSKRQDKSTLFATLDLISCCLTPQEFFALILYRWPVHREIVEHRYLNAELWVLFALHKIEPRKRKQKECAELMNTIPYCAKPKGSWTARNFGEQHRRTIEKLSKIEDLQI